MILILPECFGNHLVCLLQLNRNFFRPISNKEGEQRLLQVTKKRQAPYQQSDYLGRSRKKQAEMYKSEINGISQAQVYHYDDEEMKRKGIFEQQLWCLNIFKDLIYEKRIQTLNLQRNLRKIRLQKEEISSRK